MTATGGLEELGAEAPASHACALRDGCDPDARIGSIRGQWFARGRILFLPTFHPAAALRDPGKALLVQEDLRTLRTAYDRWRRTGERPSPLRSYPPFASHIY
ncbi:MAG: hypothetical protein ACM3XS_06085 [Bacteroidota bacterium]